MLAVTGDEQLAVSRARGGNAAAWETLFRRYQMPLYVYVRELLQDNESAMDVVQETFMRAARYLQGLRDDARFGSWLFGIAHQQCVGRWRRKTAPSVPLDDAGELAIHDPQPDELLVRKEQEADFLQALETLPAEHRSVLVLHFLEEFSLEDIASITSVPLGTVKSRLHYARKSLRDRIEKS